MKKILSRSVFVLTAILLLFGYSCTSSPKHELLPKDFKQAVEQAKNAILLDVRTPEEYAEGYIEGATNIDWTGSSFDEETSHLDKTRPVFVYCRSGKRSASAASALRSAGFKEVYELKGGIMKWQEDGLTVTMPAEKETKGAE